MTLPLDADAIASDRVVVAGARLAGTFRPAAEAFHFLRHGRTEANRLGIIQGHRDVPLDEEGRRQAAAAGALLRATGLRPARIVASDLSRAAETARIVAAALEAEVSAYDPGLRERGFGPIEGSSARHLAWTDDPAGAETVADFVARCGAALQRHLTQEGVLVVAHGGVLRAAAALLRVPLAAEARANAVPLRFARETSAWRLEFLSSAS